MQVLSINIIISNFLNLRRFVPYIMILKNF